MEWTCRDIAKMIAHSLLKPELTTDEIRKGCEVAKKIRYGYSLLCAISAALSGDAAQRDGYKAGDGDWLSARVQQDRNKGLRGRAGD